MTIGEFLKEVRTKKGLSLRKAETISGIKHTHILAVEKGKIKNPTTRTVIKLIEAYKAQAEEELQKLLPFITRIETKITAQQTPE